METGLDPQPCPRPRRLLPSLRAVTKTKELGSHLAAPRHRGTHASRSVGRRPNPIPGPRLQNDGWRTVGSGSPPDFVTATGHFQKVQRQSRELCLTEGFLNVLATKGKGKQHVKRKGNILHFPLGHAELKVNILERSPQSETHHPGSLRSAGAGCARPREGPWGLQSPGRPSPQLWRARQSPGTTTPRGQSAPATPRIPIKRTGPELHL